MSLSSVFLYAHGRMEPFPMRHYSTHMRALGGSPAAVRRLGKSNSLLRRWPRRGALPSYAPRPRRAAAGGASPVSNLDQLIRPLTN